MAKEPKETAPEQKSEGVPEEQLKRFAADLTIGLDQSVPNRLTLDGKNPAKDYRYCRPKNMEVRKSQGFVVDQDEDLVAYGMADSSTPTKRINWGDELVLMSRPKEIAEYRDKLKEESNRKRNREERDAIKKHSTSDVRYEDSDSEVRQSSGRKYFVMGS